MPQGFIKLNREKGIELLEEDPQAFLLLTQIAMRARRKDGEYSRIYLKTNQALVGDYKKIGLSRQQYRNTQKRLTQYGLATFEPTNKGTIATLTNTAVYDINAGDTFPKPPNPSMKIRDDQPTENRSETMKKPTNHQPKTIKEPVTRMEECKKATTTSMQKAEAVLYECLQNHQQLSAEEKQSLMIYPESRVLKAIKWAPQVQIKQTLIQTLHWHCKQTTPPLPPEKCLSGKTPQEVAAWEYNQFLETHAYSELAAKNREAIPKHHIYEMSQKGRGEL